MDVCQVKLRGIRFEVGEIEAIAMRSALVAAAAAVVVEELLLLYIVPTIPLESFTNAATVAVRLTLRSLLPLQLLPAQLIPLQQMPLTPGGKLLRAALPPPPPRQPLLVGGGKEGEVLPAVGGLRTHTERAAAKAWERVLKVRPG